MKQFLRRVALVFAVTTVFCAGALAFATPVSAAPVDCDSATEEHLNNPKGKVPNADKVCCPKGYAKDAKTCFFGAYVNPTIKLLAGIVMVAVVGGMTWGGIQYASSNGDPGKVKAAKTSVSKALTALVVFMVFGAFVQFMSPTSITNSGALTCNTTFFIGLKTWYAYLPPGSLDKKTCELVSTVQILPTENKASVFPQIALAVVDDLLRITALVAVAFVVTGGVQYIVSQGEPGRIKQAHSTIINALIGLAIAVMAAAVVSFVGSQLAK